MDQVKKDKMGLLHIAASNNDIHMIDFATKLGAFPTVDVKNAEGWTPTHLACFLNNFDALNILIERGADISLKHNEGLSAYEEMVRNDNADLLECVYPLVK